MGLNTPPTFGLAIAVLIAFVGIYLKEKYLGDNIAFIISGLYLFKSSSKGKVFVFEI
jgi:hypothetical protein